MPIPNLAKLERFDANMDVIERFVSDIYASNVVTPAGTVHPNIKSRLDDLQQRLNLSESEAEDVIREILDALTTYADPVPFESGLLFESKYKTVEYQGTTYSPVETALPFTTTATFDPAQWERPVFMQAAEAIAAEIREFASLPQVRGFKRRIDAENYQGDMVEFTGIQTLGYYDAFDGGAAVYERADELKPGGFTDYYGQIWNLTEHQDLCPEMFGAWGNDPDVDDSQALQDMFEFAMQHTTTGIRTVYLNPGKVYYAGDAADLIIDPGFIAIDGRGSRIVFSKTCIDIDTQPELVTNSGFDNDINGWTGFSTVDSNWRDYTQSGGEAVYDSASAQQGTYGGMYQQIDLENGQWYTLEFLPTDIQSASNQHYLTVGIRDQGPDAGAFFGKTALTADVGSVVTTEFKWTGATGTYWLQAKSNNPIAVDYISLKVRPRNECFQLIGDYSPNAIQYSPALGTLAIKNLTLEGVGTASQFGIGLFANTDTITYRSQYDLENVSIKNFAVNLLTANRAYICNWDGGGATGGKRANIILGTGSDAGENMRLTNLTIAGGACEDGAAVINQGRYVHMYGCSIDYVSQGFLKQQGGYTHLVNCHFEKPSPSEAQNYPIRIESGTVKISGGYMQLNQIDPIVIEHIAKIDRGGRWIVDDMQAFGLTTSTDEIWTGDGVAKIRFSGIGQKTVAAFPTKTEKTSLNPLSNEGGAWKYCAVDGFGTRISATETNRIALTELTSGLRTPGNRGLKITKTGGPGEAAVAVLAIPLPPDGMFSAECYTKVTANGSASGTGAIYLDWYSGDIKGHDGGVFTRTDRCQWHGEINTLRTVPWATGQDWTRAMINTPNNNNASTEMVEFGADYRTHAFLMINMTSAPTGTELHICDLISGVI